MITIDLFSIVLHILISGTVGNITVEEEGTNYVTISWSVPSVVEAEDQGYLVDWKAIHEDMDLKHNITKDNQAKIYELEPGTEYFIAVAVCVSCSNESLDVGKRSNTTVRTCKFQMKLYVVN